MESKIAATDDFESRYLQKFKVEASKYGTFIHYDKDRAAIDTEYIKIPIKVQHLKFWYASPEPVYLAIYVESADCFILEDVNEIVLRQFGEKLFSPDTFKKGQQTTTIYISKKT